MAVSRFPFRSPGTKSHLDVASVERCKVNYMGEGGGFPQVRAVVGLVSPKSPWLVIAPKVFQHSIHQWVGWLDADLSELLVTFPSPILKLQHAPLPLYSATSQGTCPDSFPFRCILFGTHIWSLKELGARHHN